MRKKGTSIRVEETLLELIKKVAALEGKTTSEVIISSLWYDLPSRFQEAQEIANWKARISDVHQKRSARRAK
jgi:hypothetical protein